MPALASHLFARAQPWLERLGFYRTVLFTSLGLDLTFKATVLPAFPDLFGVEDGSERAGVLLLAAQCSALWLSLWFLAFRLVIRRLDRHLAVARATTEPAALQRAARELHLLPRRMALLWIVEWSMILVSAVVLHRGTPSYTAVALFGAALVIGSWAVGHPLAVLLTGRAIRELSSEAHKRRIPIAAPRMTVRRRLALYSLGISLAPACYVASSAFASLGHDNSYGRMLGLMLVYFAAVALFSVVCASIFSITITRPIGEMTRVVDNITREREFSEVGRVPTYLADEIGALGECTNAMIDRLEQIAAARASMHQALEALNRTLEARIDERTAHLQHANEELAAEMDKRSRMEIELRQAQKLESVGRLAAGVAHEINTPIQFVSDSVHFVQDAMRDFATAFGKFRELHQLVARGEPTESAAQEAASAAESADLEYLFENVPKALDRSLEGLGRVAAIVRSMKEFVHPAQRAMSSVDLNRSIENTLTIARHEYKLVADVETHFGELPPVTCMGGEINQVVLNLVVNAAHAIGDAVAGTDRRGRITVSTAVDGNEVVIAVSDTGPGIPDAIRERVFDPFFTTKEVGKGTGQGLAMARSVVDRHKGQLRFDTKPGEGTTFYVRLPIQGSAPLAAVA